MQRPRYSGYIETIGILAFEVVDSSLVNQKRTVGIAYGKEKHGVVKNYPTRNPTN
jgi:hypothetical protein